jgi:two-component system chemotaxis response regulator CheY
MHDPLPTPVDSANQAASPLYHLLVVGSDSRSRRRVVAALRAQGYYVSEATDGTDAAGRAAESAADLVILDVIQPGTDGVQFLQAQHESAHLASKPTVILAPILDGDAQEIYPPALFRLYKPYDDEELLSVVEHSCTPKPHEGKVASRVNLFWSRRGEIACPMHAPVAGSARWIEEAWAAVPLQNNSHRIPYQCQYCSGRSPLQHRYAQGSR